MKAAPTSREQVERLLVLVRRSLAFWKRGALVFVVAAAIGVPVILTRPRSYRSDMVILYQETIRSADVTGTDGFPDGAHWVGGRLREMLLSRANLEPIIDDLHLYPALIIRNEDVEAVEEMRKNIVFRAQPDGDTYQISFSGTTPQEAQEVTRRLGECIIDEAEKTREEKARTLKEFLTAETHRNATDLRQTEADLARFVMLHPEFTLRLQGLPPPGTAPAAPGASPTVPAPDPGLASLEGRAASIERRLNGGKGAALGGPESTSGFTPPPEGAELATARRNLADKLSTYTDKHPDVIAARSRLQAAVEQQEGINRKAYEAWRAQQTDGPGSSPVATMDDAALGKELGNLRAQIAARRLALAGPVGAAMDAGIDLEGRAPGLELQFRGLQADVNDARDRQQQLEQRLFRASITASSIMDDRNVEVSVLDPAYLPVRPVSKPRSLLLGGLLAIALLLAIATAVMSASVDDRIYDKHDLERMVMLPVLGVIPGPPRAERRPAAGAR